MYDSANPEFDITRIVVDFTGQVMTSPTGVEAFPNRVFHFSNPLFDISNCVFDFPHRVMTSPTGAEAFPNSVFDKPIQNLTLPFGYLIFPTGK